MEWSCLWQEISSAFGNQSHDSLNHVSVDVKAHSANLQRKAKALFSCLFVLCVGCWI